jgi:aminomethyltransferase
MAKVSPIHTRISKLCQSNIWIPWAGYMIAGSYIKSVQEEYSILRNAAALFDVSPFSKYHVRGSDALKLLNILFTRDVSQMESNRVIYSPWCDPDGKVRQEGTLFRFEEDYFMICAGEPDLEWFQRAAVGYNVEILDRSVQDAALALQGPSSCRILQEASNIDVEHIKFYGIAQGKIAGVQCMVSRTGYSGDLGYEIWVNADNALTVWDHLLELGKPYNARPCGVLCLDIARLEAGFVFSGGDPEELAGDYTRSPDALTEDQKLSPYEIGLGWTVDLDKKDFIGREALAKQKEQGSKWQLVGLEVEQKPFDDLYLSRNSKPDFPSMVSHEVLPLRSTNDGRQIGRVTSRVISIQLDKYIALAIVESACANLNTEMAMECTVFDKCQQIPCKVVKLPFFVSKRMKEKNINKYLK